ncbi:MAG: DNA polymerase III subunit delta [Deltaproteobacteria bacterium]|nr:DNA polymerase III subunit delta [Deltaproteobacteria bacterium]
MSAKSRDKGPVEAQDAAMPRALLFLGESSLVDPVVEQAIARVLPGEARSLNLEVFRHGERPLDEALAALRQVGMFAAERCVWIRGGAPRAKPKKETKGEAREKAQDSLEEDEDGDEELRAGDFGDDLFALLEAGLPPATTLLVSAPSLDARGRAYKWFAKNGQIRDLRVEVARGGRPDADRARRIVEDRLGAAGVRDFDSGAVEEIVRRAGNNFGELLQEIDRLCVGLADPTRLRVADVRGAMRDLASAWVFDLTDALGARNLGKAELLLEKLLGEGEVPQRLVALLATHFASLIEARAMVALLPRGALSMQGNDFLRGPLMELPEAFRRRYPGWRAYFLIKAAANFSLAELRAVHHEVLVLDLALKGSRSAPLMLFSRFLHRACPASRTAPR